MKKIFLVIITILGISGCVQRQYVPTQSEIRKTNDVATVESAQGRFNRCQAEIVSPQQKNPKLLASAEIVTKQVYYDKEDSPNKLDLMSSSAKISDKQKNALLDVLAANQLCRAGLKTDLGTFPSLLVVYENYYGEMDIVNAQLISKKITIGDANTQKAKLQVKAKSDYVTASTNLNNQYNAAISQESQARQAEDMQRRAIASQYLMNQQAINAQQQINQQNQINNSRPVNTNCTRMGNSVNCTSY
ncbi:MAG: hypothetical protein B7Y05_08190 [Polynucleobacter sp. 24-46-87]|jgi:hypothetical protein|nr:MAG: hypothetical protein B7Y05_08190 [Polynucleobacter sp. 24-46-87]OZA41546.1 MAG: hypothetical protein B7X83_02040 [Polynucleobacter sp. 17-46-58]HQT21000.1 hypothetical protein [Polynucleobacter sp.]HQT41483.1 hypothetical protein [Polynucleobacter sp.]